MNALRRGLALALSVYLTFGPGIDEALAALDAETTTNPMSSGKTPSGAGTPASGLESFKTDLATGSASFSIPIEVPPGTAGMQPSVALAYSSSAGKSWAGFGWMLDLGRISRRTQKGVPKYDSTDEFQLDSTRLVLGSDQRYHTEVESFVRIEHKTTGGDWWEVTSKDGKKLYFGSSPESRIANGATIFAWLLDKVEDPFGNFLLAFYQDGGDGANRYVRSIKYTYHSGTPENGGLAGGSASERRIDFCLESSAPTDDACDPTTLLARADPIINYQSGFRIQTTRRLKSIRTYFGNNLIRRYNLTYLEPGLPVTGSSVTSRLASVQVLGSDGATALPLVTFTYTPGAAGFGACQNDWANPSDSGPEQHLDAMRTQTSGGESKSTIMDLTGDGVPDRVVVHDATNWKTWPVNLSGTGYIATSSLWAYQTGGDPQSFNAENLRETIGGKVRVELIDMDGNGLPDRVAQNDDDDTKWKVFWNDGGAQFDPWDANDGPWPNPSYQEEHKYDAVRFPNFLKTEIEADVIDMNGDGLPDRVIQDPADEFKWKVYRNRGRNGSPAGFDPSYSSWIHRTDKTINGIQERNTNGIQADLIDLNGDGLPDRVWVVHNDRYWRVWFNTGSGFAGCNASNDPCLWDNPSYLVDNSFEDLRAIDGPKHHAELEDINGDGLLDRITKGATSSTFRVYLNTGASFSTALIPWTNLSANIEPREQQEGSDIKVDLADVNGDGLTDRVMYNGEQGKWQVCPYDKPKPDLLSRIDNGLGGSVEVDYKTSTQYLNSAGTNRASLSLPFPVQTVLEVRRKDGVGDPAAADQRTAYHYAGGSYDADSREFRGFGTVTTVEGLATDAIRTKTETVFLQDDRLKGQVAEVKVYSLTPSDAATLLTHVVNEFLHPVNDAAAYATANEFGGANVQLALVKRTQATVYGPSKQATTAVSFVYDKFGNVKEQLEEGLVGTGTPPDERKTCTNYASVSTTETYARAGFPTEVSVTGGNFNCGTQTVSRTTFVYAQTGDVDGFWLTRKDWLHNPLGGLDKDVVTNRTADPYGNVRTIQPIAGDGLDRTTTIYYDGEGGGCPADPLATSTRTFACRVVNPLGHTADSYYDAGRGVSLKEIDSNGHTTLTTYDTLGRVKKVTFLPTVGSAAVLREYNYPAVPPSGTPPPPPPEGYWGTTTGTGRQNVRMIDYATAETTPDRNDGIETRTYFDGLGRTTRLGADGDDQQTVDTITTYDSRGRVSTRSIPFFALTPPSPLPKTTFTYDALGRVTQVQDPKGNCTLSTFDALDTTVELRKTCSDSAVAQRRGTSRDAYGNIIEVREYNVPEENPGTDAPYRTTYEFDALDNLVRARDACGQTPPHPNCIVTVGTQKHETVIDYDSLSRKVRTNDPGMAVWTYTYDDAGNLKTQTDAKGETITFTYDALDRILLKDYSGSQADIVFMYDGATPYASPDPQATNPKGRLTGVIDAAGKIKYGYDPRGNVSRFIRDYPSINKRFEFSYLYDNLNRISLIAYPKKTNGSSVGSLFLDYADGSLRQTRFPQAITGDGDLGLQDFVKPGTAYDAFGNLTEYVDGSNVRTKLDYESETGQMKENTVTPVGSTTPLFRQRYTYEDATQFIKSIVYDEGTLSDQLFEKSGIVPAYDALGRLRVARGPWQPGSVGVDGFNTYDPIGNILVKDQVNTMPSVWKNLTYGDAESPHAVTQLATQDASLIRTYSYDDNGNMSTRITGGTTTRAFVWDQDNRLLRVTENGTPLRDFLYDYTGERVYGYSYTHGQALYLPTRDFEWSSFHGSANVFVFLGSVRVAVVGLAFTPENIPAGGWVKFRQFLDATGTAALGLWPLLLMALGLGFLRWWTRPGRVPVPVLMRRMGIGVLVLVFLNATARPARAIPPPYAGSVNQILYYHGDYKGSESLMLAPDQTPVQSIDYWPFGSVRGSLVNGNYLVDVRHKFTDQELDNDLGLYYYGGRWYDPEIGRFISPDPFVQEPFNPQTLNRYTYVINNPTNLVDPSGYSFWTKLFSFFDPSGGGITAGLEARENGGKFWEGFGRFYAAKAAGAVAGSIVGSITGGLPSIFVSQYVSNRVLGYDNQQALQNAGIVTGILVAAVAIAYVAPVVLGALGETAGLAFSEAAPYLAAGGAVAGSAAADAALRQQIIDKANAAARGKGKLRFSDLLDRDTFGDELLKRIDQARGEVEILKVTKSGPNEVSGTFSDIGTPLEGDIKGGLGKIKIDPTVTGSFTVNQSSLTLTNVRGLYGRGPTGILTGMKPKTLIRITPERTIIR